MPARNRNDTMILGAVVATILACSGTARAQSVATPQVATPTPLPPNVKPDTPGGAARNGVITPPASGADAGINRGAPPASTLSTPVIPPPGSPGGNPTVVPK